MQPSHNQPEYSVSEIAGALKRVVEDTFAYVRVRGEISKFAVNAGSGHAYLSLKDDKAVLDAVCWRGVVSRLSITPEAGMEVIATGKLSTYPGSSKYQLIIEAMEPAGVGALMAMLEARKKQLAAEGLFAPERKKPIPFLPNRIGVITSPTGAVIRDILHRIADRFPREVVLWPVAVQGQAAAAQIAAAIAGFNALPDGHALKPDVLIVGRGGGSIEDLWAFNEEIVVRAASASAIPLISAVGHETDTTLMDYAADKRAPTPTGAAEMAVPVRAELQQRVYLLQGQLSAGLHRSVQVQAQRLEAAARQFHMLPRQLEALMQRLDEWGERLQLGLPRLLQQKRERLAAMRLAPATLQQMVLREGDRLQQATFQLSRSMLQRFERLAHRVEMHDEKLRALNPEGVLKRGFVLVRDAKGALVTSVASAKGSMQLQFHDGVQQVQSGKPKKDTGQGDLF